MKVPNSKFQIPKRLRALFGAGVLGFSWNLEFGTWSFSSC
jgi:hypothetical protein